MLLSFRVILSSWKIIPRRETTEEPQGHKWGTPILRIYSSKLLLCEPCRPTGVKAAGLLVSTLYYEASSLMRPNKPSAQWTKTPQPCHLLSLSFSHPFALPRTTNRNSKRIERNTILPSYISYNVHPSQELIMCHFTWNCPVKQRGHNNLVSPKTDDAVNTLQTRSARVEHRPLPWSVEYNLRDKWKRPEESQCICNILMKM